MDDARTKFFTNMERDMAEARGSEAQGRKDGLDIEFTITQSGRTVAHMVTDNVGRKGSSDGMDFSITESGRTVEHLGFSESEREDLVKALGSETPAHDSGVVGSENEAKSAPQQQQQSRARSIPVPTSQSVSQPVPAAASSQGSSGSAFLSSVLNPTATTFNNTQLSHTPPTALGTSYEASHFGKRMRSGSVSGRLRSASEYLEEKGLLDQQTKGILKDLIIIGDEELQQALDRYESGDPSELEKMIASGALQDRLPKDLDLLGDLDLDFLTMGDDTVGSMGDSNIEALKHPGSDDFASMQTRSLASQSQSIPMQPAPSFPSQRQVQQMITSRNRSQQAPTMVSPNYDDGIGELEFAGDFVADQQADYMHLQPQSSASSRQASAAASPAETNALSEYERRMRSNSLFSALFNEPRANNNSGVPNATMSSSDAQYGRWMDRSQGATGSRKQGIQINSSGGKAPRRKTVPQSGIGASLEADKKRREKKKKGKKDKAKQDKKKAATSDDFVEEHIPGSGRPRSLSDPNLRTTIDEHGLTQVDRPEDWVGAYSPESRKVRIERFLAKRQHRVWTKTVKYDVRKNFADGRLRVKGRFVKKEDELMMRELMSLT